MIKPDLFCANSFQIKMVSLFLVLALVYDAEDKNKSSLVLVVDVPLNQ